MFKRHAYKLINGTQKLTLVHYPGDNSVAADFPHRSAKQNSNCNFRTLASYLKSCEGKVAVEKANFVYKQEIAAMKDAAMKDDEPLGQPRNVQQLRNLHFRVMNSKPLSHDSLYNLHELGYDMPGTIWKITTLPDLVCVCRIQKMFEELDRVLLLGDCGQVL